MTVERIARAAGGANSALLLLTFLGVAPSCTAELEDSGSNTNWYALCNEDDECGDGASCLCGICTARCDEACPAPDAICASPDSRAVDEACARPHAELDGGAALCLRACDARRPCPGDSICLDGACLPLDTTEGACPKDAEIELDVGDAPLSAREGTLFSSELYVPASYPEAPTDWVEPESHRLVRAHVTAEGEPLAGCAVRFLTDASDGWAFSTNDVTDEAGDVTALWLAGTDEEPSLRAVIARRGATPGEARVTGLALAHDEPPLHEDETLRRTTTRASTLSLGYALEGETNALRVTLTPRTLPHRSFYAALSLSHLFAGLQNTSDVDAEDASVPGADRLLLFSVWNTAENEAVELFRADEVTCGAHDQDEGGIRCFAEEAWDVPGEAFVFEFEITGLDEGETGPGYEELGYDVAPCASSTGCTDYTLFFGKADEPETLRRVVALRHPERVPMTGFGSFVQPYLELASETSCLLTKRYDALFRAEARAGGEYREIRSASPSAARSTLDNQVCQNYGAGTFEGQFWLGTGGPSALGRPFLQGETTELLTLD